MDESEQQGRQPNLKVVPFPGRAPRDKTEPMTPGIIDVSFLPHDFPGSVDFRVERIRRALRAGKAPELLLAQRKYTRDSIPEACWFIGRALSIVHDSVHPEVERWHRLAAEAGHVPASGSLFQWQASNRNFEGAFESLKLTAQGGDERAMCTLVYVCRYTDVRAPDFVTAYLHEGATRGDRFAEFYLAEAYQWGQLGLEKDYRRALELYMRAANQGDADALCAIGVHFATGEVAKQDIRRAMQCYSEASRRGNAQAMAYLGYSYLIGRPPLERSVQNANRWYRRAALRGIASAQYDLGMSYLEGRELPQNDALANKWFGRATRGHVTQATHELARSYYLGRGIVRSFPKAANLDLVATRDARDRRTLDVRLLDDAPLLFQGVLPARPGAPAQGIGHYGLVRRGVHQAPTWTLRCARRHIIGTPCPGWLCGQNQTLTSMF